MIRNSLERYRYRPQRMTVIKELQKHIREKPEAVEESGKISNLEFAPDDLLPFIRD
jgi:hypothetical protein